MLLQSIKVHENVKLDFFHIEEASETNPNIFYDALYKPVLNNNSRFLVTFDDQNLIAQGVSASVLNNSYAIYREALGLDYPIIEYVGTIDSGALTISDYNIENNRAYRYHIFKEDDQTMSSAVISEPATSCWWNISLTDLIPDSNNKFAYRVEPYTIFMFDLNVSTGETTHHFQNSVNETLSEFPKVSTGPSRYKSGSITCLLGQLTTNSNGKIDYYEEYNAIGLFNNFCSNGNPKLLKMRDGKPMIVMITGVKDNIDDVTVQQEHTITFDWVEVASVDDKIITFSECGC